MHWNVQSVKCMDKRMEQDDGKNTRVMMQTSKKGFEKN